MIEKTSIIGGLDLPDQAEHSTRTISLEVDSNTQQ